ncbi:MAG: hypothetical protein K8S98_04820 [Planctomycetes bacterium]|nr:hypothetical protein [Planctomycetota bacterium]
MARWKQTAWTRVLSSALAVGGSALVLLTAQNTSNAAASSKVWVVGPNPPAMTDIQIAVDSAAAGDIVLVDSGTYAGFTIDGKALTIAARVDTSAGEAVLVNGTVRIANLAAGSAVVLQGDAFTIDGQTANALEVVTSLGSVRVQGLTLLGGCATLGADGGAGLMLDQAADVALMSTTAKGGGVCEYPASGGDGIHVTQSQLALYSVTSEGGHGGEDLASFGTDGTAGGSGCVLVDGFLFSVHSTFTGADAGSGGDGLGDCITGIPPGQGGNGGHGLVLGGSGATARLMDTSRVGGIGGTVGGGTTCTQTDGAPGLADSLAAGATLTEPATPVRLTHAPNLSHELSGIQLSFEGVPGDHVYVFLSTATQFVDMPPFAGVSLAKGPFFYRVSMGIVGPTGVLDSAIGVSSLPVGVQGEVWHVQTFVRTLAKKRLLGGPATLVVLDSQF